MSKAPSKPCLLVGDIGGTNARFALADPTTPGFSREMTFECRDFESADVAISAYLKKIDASKPDVICFAAAGPVINGKVRFTNNNWSLDIGELEQAFTGASVRLLNDFAAIAYSIPHLQPDDCIQVGSPTAADLIGDNFTIGIVGPGTGLGAAGLLQKNAVVCPIIGEGGHVGFAPETPLQVKLLAQIADQFERVCDERLVSGPGLVNIYRALGNIRGENLEDLKAAEIFALATESSDAIARETVEIFFEVLGQVAGNLALSLGAYDGIFIGGGIVARKPELIADSQFRTGFERKGRHRSLMESIPTQVIVHAQPGLLGASYCALQTHRGDF